MTRARKQTRGRLSALTGIHCHYKARIGRVFEEIAVSKGIGRHSGGSWPRIAKTRIATPDSTGIEELERPKAEEAQAASRPQKGEKIGSSKGAGKLPAPYVRVRVEPEAHLTAVRKPLDTALLIAEDDRSRSPCHPRQQLNSSASATFARVLARAPVRRGGCHWEPLL